MDLLFVLQSIIKYFIEVLNIPCKVKDMITPINPIKFESVKTSIK